VGYFRKKVASGNYSIDQAIVAPFGDDPVLISQVTIANHMAVAREPALDRVLGMPGLSVLVPRLHRTIRRRRQRGGTAAQVRRSLHA
jgi:hypothetical protein